MYTGACLCGEIEYEIDADFSESSHCHCSQCQKAHGAAFGSYGNIKKDQLRWVKGLKHLKYYPSSEDVLRGFCQLCGSNLLWISKANQDGIGITLGTIDLTDSQEITIDKHIYVASKAAWFDITDDIDQFKKYRD